MDPPPASTPSGTTDAERPPPPDALATASEVARRLGPLTPLAIIASTFPVAGLILTFYFINSLAEWLRSHGDTGPFLYVGAFGLLGGLGLLPTHAVAALAGWAFGTATGGLTALCGFTVAGVIAYALARWLGGDRAERLIAEHPKWRAVYKALVCSGFWRALGIVTLIRLPLSPFALSNIIMAATRVPLPAFAVGTFVGLAPRTLAVVSIAAGLKEFSLSSTRNPWLYGVGVALTVLAVVIIATIANRAIARFTAQSSKAA